MTRIKLCGMFREEDIAACNAVRPDWIGFVFEPHSSRYVSAKQAEHLKSLLDPGICSIGVFTDQPLEEMAHLVNEGIIEGIQLHGNQQEEDIQALRRLTPALLIQAFRVRSEEDLERARNSGADLILLDAGNGSGQTFDWSLLKDMDRPYILAGGLNPENIGQALEQLHPWGVDVSSGIETDQKKDPGKMESFCRTVRGRNHE